MPQLRAEIRTLEELQSNAKADMFALYSSFYDATNKIDFDKDLTTKTHTVLLHDENNTLQGFTSLARYTQNFNGKQYQIVYSGDTIIHSSFWGEQTLPEAWIQLTGRFKSEYPELPLYWFLIVKGHRTYRYLSIFSKQYYPNHRETTPTDTQQFLNQLAEDRFPAHYQPETGLIQFPESRGHLSAQLGGIPENALKRKEVQHFLALNPGYTQGDELACITELSLENLSRRARVYFEKGLNAC